MSTTAAIEQLASDINALVQMHGLPEVRMDNSGEEHAHIVYVFGDAGDDTMHRVDIKCYHPNDSEEIDRQATLNTGAFLDHIRSHEGGQVDEEDPFAGLPPGLAKALRESGAVLIGSGEATLGEPRVGSFAPPSEAEADERPQLIELNPPEKLRRYVWLNKGEVTIDNVTHFLARPSGSHRLKTADGKLVIIPHGADADAIEIQAAEFTV